MVLMLKMMCLVLWICIMFFLVIASGPGRMPARYRHAGEGRFYRRHPRRMPGRIPSKKRPHGY